MPILKRETSLFPDDLFDETYQAHHLESGARWWAIYTISRKEKDFMRKLNASKVAFYCPIIAKTYRSTQGRTRTSYLPLFTNYVFLFGNEEQRQIALKTNCISQCLQIPQHTELVKDLRQIETLINTKETITVESQLQPGEAVRIKTGPFAGIEGTIFQRRSQARFMVTVNYLQQGASLLLGEWDLEKIY